ncbi:MAG: Rpn family recombination-promoting nuclease/putative transposase [Bacteroides sp.]|nr:Rpn family recombination-promoting nuclease/putative transposase [Bacteroides sp.]
MCTEGIIDRYVNFYTDFAFKKLFGTEMNKDLLISFLNALLHGREEIEDINYLNKEHIGTQEYDRRAVFDVYCKNNNGEMFVVEMQKGEQQFFKDRSIYYSSFAIREQAPKGVWNYELKGVYTIGILNFCFTDSRNKEYYHEVKLLDTRTKELFYDKLTFIYLEMPNFIKKEDELESMFDKWMYAIRHLGALEKRPDILREKIFQRLFDVAEIAKFDRKERYEYEDSLKAYRDWFSVMETAEIRGMERGMKKGMEKGMDKGMEEGMKQGIEEGKHRQLIDTARRMKELGMDDDLIAHATGLSSEEIANC